MCFNTEVPRDCAILRPAFRMTACILWDVLCHKWRNTDAQSASLIHDWFGLLLSLIRFIVKSSLKNNCTNWGYHNHPKYALLPPLMQYGHISVCIRVLKKWVKYATQDELYDKLCAQWYHYIVQSTSSTTCKTRHAFRSEENHGIDINKKYHKIGDMLSNMLFKFD